MGRLAVGRMLATGSVVAGATAVRITLGGANVAVDRVPALIELGLKAACKRPGSSAATAQAAFRDELVGLFRDCAESSWRELRRGVDDLDHFTRQTPGPQTPGPQTPGHRHRRHRVKA
ncbi:MAG: hypothetical protein ACYDHH_10115 [Solirubrobacteraceae bacterium]